MLWAAALVLASGCQAPFLVFSGGALEGDVVEIQSFAFADSFRLLRLEVRPDAPYSVILRVTVIERELYIDAAPGRRWHRYLAENSMVRVKLGDTLYPARAVVVEEPEIVKQFLTGRTIYRIEPASVDI